MSRTTRNRPDGQTADCGWSGSRGSRRSFRRARQARRQQQRRARGRHTEHEAADGLDEHTTRGHHREDA